MNSMTDDLGQRVRELKGSLLSAQIMSQEAERARSGHGSFATRAEWPMTA